MAIIGKVKKVSDNSFGGFVSNMISTYGYNDMLLNVSLDDLEHKYHVEGFDEKLTVEELVSNLEEEIRDYDELKREYDKLEGRYSNLLIEYNNIKGDLSLAIGRYNECLRINEDNLKQYIKAIDEHDELKVKLKTMQRDYYTKDSAILSLIEELEHLRSENIQLKRKVKGNEL